MKTKKTIVTSWDLRTYDTWGNSEDGYDVNNVFSAGSVSLRLRVERNNPDTEHEFLSASPSDYQIKRVFDVGCAIDTDGDDMVIYVNRARDGYPIGEMHCTSHDSLSPIRSKSRE